MSFDLVVFDQKYAPSDRDEFMDWFKIRSTWGEGHSYNDPKVTTERLQNWFHEMILSFPTLNGPYSTPIIDPSSEMHDNQRLTDYSIGKDMIYISFGWSIAEQAYIETKRLALKHSLGFYNVSDDDAEIIYPSDNT